MSFGFNAGTGAIDKIITLAEQLCKFEKERIEAVNEPQVLVCRIALQYLQKEEQSCLEALAEIRMRDARPGHGRVFYLVIALALTAASLALSLFALEPFRLGWKLWVFASGIAVCVPFAIDYFLHRWLNEQLLRLAAAILLGASILSILIFAELRGNLLRHEIATTTASVEFEGDAPSSQPTDDFGSHAATLLWAAMTFISVALELGAGLAVYESSRASAEHEKNGASLRAGLRTIRADMISLAHRKTELQNEPRVMAAIFWRDFYHGLLTGVRRNGIAKFFALVLCSITIARLQAQPVSAHQIIAVLDLSGTETVRSAAGQTELQENIKAIGQLLATIPADTKLAIVGVTDNSQPPDILLSARVSADDGYFGERVAAARRGLVARWHRLTPELRTFRHTHLFEAVALAGNMFAQSAAPEKILVLLSDMREESPGFNLERPGVIDVQRMMSRLRERKMVASLPNVKVYVLAAHAANRDLTFWASLRDFWTQYFMACDARVRAFSMTREMSQLEREW